MSMVSAIYVETPEISSYIRYFWKSSIYRAIDTLSKMVSQITRSKERLKFLANKLMALGKSQLLKKNYVKVTVIYCHLEMLTGRLNRTSNYLYFDSRSAFTFSVAPPNICVILTWSTTVTFFPFVHLAKRTLNFEVTLLVLTHFNSVLYDQIRFLFIGSRVFYTIFQSISKQWEWSYLTCYFEIIIRRHPIWEDVNHFRHFIIWRSRMRNGAKTNWCNKVYMQINWRE